MYFNAGLGEHFRDCSAKDIGDLINDIDGRTVDASLERADIRPVELRQMRQFLLRKPLGISHSLQVPGEFLSYRHTRVRATCRVYFHGVSSTKEKQLEIVFGIDEAVTEESVSKTAKKASPIDIQVGERIKLRRRAIGMSQERLGQALGITFQQVQKYEKGTNRVGASRIMNIATVLGMPVSHFFPDHPDLPSSTSTASAGGEELVSFLATVEGRMLNTAFARIHGPLKRKIVSLVVAIARAEEEGATPGP